MELQNRISIFTILGKFLSQFKDKNIDPEFKILNTKFYDSFHRTIKNAEIFNPWFTEANTRLALGSLSDILTKEKLEKWTKTYNPLLFDKNKKVGVIMAGNIPMVGFHDMLCVLMSGNILVGKLSSKDDKLLKAIGEILIFLEPEFEKFIIWEEKFLTNIDAIIATGSDNSSRYFESYFKKYPHIIRKNRNSVAILTGTETTEEMQLLGQDILSYFGLGCRNVSKLFVPEGYNFNHFFESIEHFSYLANHSKFANNREYNRAIYLVNTEHHLDNGFILLKENNTLSSPIAVLYFETYKNFENVKEKLIFDIEKIQCVVTDSELFDNRISFGQTQKPQLWDYADNVDTMEFLLNI